jgi:hypothetical protein
MGALAEDLGALGNTLQRVRWGTGRDATRAALVVNEAAGRPMALPDDEEASILRCNCARLWAEGCVGHCPMETCCTGGTPKIPFNRQVLFLFLSLYDLPRTCKVLL